MTDLAWFVSGAALFDSVSTTQQIIILILLFSTNRPLPASLGFLVGLSGAYLLCGALGLAFVAPMMALVAVFVPNLNALPDAAYYQAQGLTGAVLLAAGPLWWWWQSRSRKPSLENQLISRLKGINFGGTLALGAFLSVTSFPFALPYVASIGKIAAASLGATGGAGFLLLYNLVYALPMLVLFGVFVALRDAVLPRLHLHVQRLNLLITVLLLSGMGAFLLMDCWFFSFTGKALLTSRFL